MTDVDGARMAVFRTLTRKENGRYDNMTHEAEVEFTRTIS